MPCSKAKRNLRHEASLPWDIPHGGQSEWTVRFRTHSAPKNLRSTFAGPDSAARHHLGDLRIPDLGEVQIVWVPTFRIGQRCRDVDGSSSRSRRRDI